MTIKHGMSGTVEYKTWRDLIQRCTNPKSSQYHNYGGRGIGVCDEWRASFLSFFADMGYRPPNTSIDRIDVDGNYEPSNCRWASKIEQARNRRDLTPDKCWRGHPFTEENTYYRPDSPTGRGRQCRACCAIRDAERLAKRRGKKAPCPVCGKSLATKYIAEHLANVNVHPERWAS